METLSVVKHIRNSLSNTFSSTENLTWGTRLHVLKKVLCVIKEAKELL